MIDQKHVQVCCNRCCFYLEGKAISSAEYEEKRSAGWLKDSTLIPCLGHQGSKYVLAASREIGHYLGYPEASADRLLHSAVYAYDVRTHEYLREATALDKEQWLEMAQLICSMDQ
jgi:hypothetical protein